MQIHINKDGQQYGPYTEAEAAGHLRTGQFSATDLAWREGSPDWVPLSQLVSVPPPDFSSQPSIPPADRAAAPDGFSDTEILDIASRQRAIIWLILGSLAAMFIPYAPFVTGILSLIFIYQLARSVRSSVAWLYAIFALIPLIGLIALLTVNSKATAALQSRGVRVGLMGANQSDLDKLKV